MNCILCNQKSTFYVSADLLDQISDYYHCAECDLVFLDPKDFLDPKEEQDRYALHENDIGDQGFLKFVTPLLNVIQTKTTKDQSGLDFGCGPGPIIAHELKKKAYNIKCYDPFYANDREALKQKYDFVFANEVVEHFHKPLDGFRQCFQLLKPKESFLFIGTQIRANDKQAFKSWYYRRDPTHTCFYSEITLKWLATKFEAKLEILPPRIAVFSRTI